MELMSNKARVLNWCLAFASLVYAVICGVMLAEKNWGMALADGLLSLFSFFLFKSSLPILRSLPYWRKRYRNTVFELKPLFLKENPGGKDILVAAVFNPKTHQRLKLRVIPMDAFLLQDRQRFKELFANGELVKFSWQRVRVVPLNRGVVLQLVEDP